MKYLLLVMFSALVINQVYGNGDKIVAAARSQFGVPFSWGGGGIKGKSIGLEKHKDIKGFDSDGLAQYSVYQGTNKVIGRVASAQYRSRQCHHVPYSKREPGDLVFFGKPIRHVGIVSGRNKMIISQGIGTTVHEEPIRKYHLKNVVRCW